jgi:pantoate kinase
MARGKTKGATSFVSVSLETLNSILRPEASVMVSRRYAETLGLESDNIKVTSNDMKKEIKGKADIGTSAVELKVIDF